MNFLKRIKHLQKTIEQRSLHALIIANTLDIYYLTGLNLSLGHVIFTTTDALLLVDGRYIEYCNSHSPIPVKLTKDHNLLPHLSQIYKENTLVNIGFDSKELSYEGYTSLYKRTQAQSSLKIKLVPIPYLLKDLRVQKDSEEIQALSFAADLGTKGYQYVIDSLKKGVTEIQLAQDLEIFWKKNKSQSVAFEPIIAFGYNTAHPHYHPQEVALKTGDPILIDIGVKIGNYHSDMTRTVFFKRIKPELAKIYNIVKEAQQKALDLCKPGVLLKDLDSTARNHIEANGYGEYFNHSLGHGIGLEVHENPAISHKSASEVLLPGMAITIEPGIYLPNLGGVRIEDTIIITKKSYKNLTTCGKELTIL